MLRPPSLTSIFYASFRFLPKQDDLDTAIFFLQILFQTMPRMLLPHRHLLRRKRPPLLFCVSVFLYICPLPGSEFLCLPPTRERKTFKGTFVQFCILCVQQGPCTFSLECRRESRSVTAVPMEPEPELCVCLPQCEHYVEQ